jgi:hypothetical protein
MNEKLAALDTRITRLREYVDGRQTLNGRRARLASLVAYLQGQTGNIIYDAVSGDLLMCEPKLVEVAKATVGAIQAVDRLTLFERRN